MYHLFDIVLLKDGREGAIVECFGNGEAFLVDVGSSPSDWETIDVKHADIEKVLIPSTYVEESP